MPFAGAGIAKVNSTAQTHPGLPQNGGSFSAPIMSSLFAEGMGGRYVNAFVSPREISSSIRLATILDVTIQKVSGAGPEDAVRRVDYNARE
jgi:hypothetical protein